MDVVVRAIRGSAVMVQLAQRGGSLHRQSPGWACRGCEWHGMESESE